MSNTRFITLLLGLGMLGACGAPEERRLDVQDDDGAADVSVDMPGVEGRFRIPAIKLDNADVDIDGVKLYPGTKVTGVELSGEEGHSEGALVIRFRADAAPASVRDYYLEAFSKKGMRMTASGNGITGQDSNGKPISIALVAQEGGTMGTVRLGRRAR